MLINTVSDFRVAARNPYAWPGGYPTYFICDDGAALCHDCAGKERRLILQSVHDKARDGWRVVALDINYEDSALYCDHCSKQIESAYGDDNN
jgi:hypothetical protein